MSNYPTTNGYWVYGHRTPDNHWYIGMSQMQPKERWNPLLYKKTTLHQYINQYGWNNIEHCVFNDGLTKKEAELLEDEYIMRFRNDGLCINKQRSGGIKRDKTDEWKREQREYHKQWYEDNRECILERQKQYNQVNAERRKEQQKQYRASNAEKIKQYNAKRNSKPEQKIYNRVKDFNRRHPDRIVETPMEAKQKYLETGYIPDYIKKSDLQ